MSITNHVFCLKDFSLAPEIFLSCSILQLTFFAVSTTYNRKSNFVILNTSFYYITSLILGLTLLLIINENLLANNTYISNNSIINDYLSFTVKITIGLFSFLFSIVINVAVKEEEPVRNHFEYVILIMISVLSLLILCSANDLITAYLAVELQSIAFYIMAAFKKNSTYSIESSLKYFIIGSLASAFFLFGSAILYGCLGSLNFDDFRMFSSLLFQKDISFNTSDLFKDISPASLTLIRLLSVTVVDKADVPICPKHCYTVPLNWIEKITTSVMSHPFNDSLQNIFLYLSPFFVIERTENFSSSLMDYYLNDFSNYNNVLPTEIIKVKLDVKDTSSYEKLLAEFFKEETDTIINPLIYWFTLFEKSFSTLGTQSYTYYNQFDLSVPNVYYNDKNHFLKHCDFVLDFNNLEKYLVKNYTELNNEPTALIFKKIFFLYNQMSLSSVDLSNNTFEINTNFISLGFFFICVSIFIKLAVAPFHYWSLDVYEGSPNKTTTFFAVIPKIALFVLLTRICYNSFYYIFIDHYQIYFILLSIVSIFIGSIGGLEQRKIKTLFAYSSLSHTGYILLSFSTGSVEGIQLMFYYLVLYMLSSICFWSVYLFLIKKNFYYSNKNNKELGDFVLLKESNPMLALILSVTLFSIAGIPPIVGFLAKIGIFLVVVKSSAYLVAIIGILLSVVSTFYYIRFIKILYFDNSMVGKLYIPISTKKSLVIALLSILLLVLCINPVILYLTFYKVILLLNY